MGEERSFLRCQTKAEKGGHPLPIIVKELFKTLIDEKLVDAFLALTEKKKGGGMQTVSAETMTNVDTLDKSLISQFSVGGLPRLHSVPKIVHTQLMGCFDKKLAVLARPCDIRGLIELSKRHQVAFSNLFIIGLDCPGNVPILDLLGAVKKREIDPSRIEFCEIAPKEVIVKIAEEEEKLSLEIGKDIKLRESCTRCNNRKPTTCEITLSTYNKDLTVNGMILIRPETERGKKILESSEKRGLLEVANSPTKEENEQRDSAVKTLEERATEKLMKDNKEFTKLGSRQRFDQFREKLKPCTKCGLCIRACPVCWCKDCILLKKAKTLDPILLHLTRFVHMGDSCVNCGKCDENCPKGIELSKMYYGLTSEISRLTGYRPGLVVNQLPPRSVKVILQKAKTSD